MKLTNFLLSLFLIIFISACKPKPRDINYGEDICTFCKMTVVSKQHAAEVVSQKGKVYTFDAIECMINYVQKEETEFGHLLVNDYLDPGELKDAHNCQYLISENLPSPMGAFLSAFSNKEDAQKMQEERSGKLYDWESLNQHFKDGSPNNFQ